MRHERRILVNDVLEPRRFGELFHLGLEVQNDLRPARHIAFDRCDREASRTVGLPTPAGLFLVAPRDDDDLFGEHERRIEADTELTNQRQISLGFASR